MGQHNSFKKDIDMLSEAYGQMYSDKKVVEEGRMGAAIGAGLGGLALGPLGAIGGAALGAGGDKKSDEETHDKTGQKSDHDLLDAVEKKHTAGKALLDKARSELQQNGSLSAHTRDSLARDEYGYGGEDAEMIHGNKPLTSREKAAHSQGKGPYKQQEYNPWDDLPEGWDDDEDAEDTDEADQKRFKKYDKEVDDEAEGQGFNRDAN